MPSPARLPAFVLAPLLALASLLPGVAPAAAAEPPRVVVSIKPVHSLVAAVTQGIGEPVLLLQTGASPHTYSLRPSDAKVLRQAQLVFWVGEGLETFLVKPMAALGKDARSVELAEVPGVSLLPYRTGEDWEAHAHDTHDDAHDDAHHGHETAHDHAADNKHGHAAGDEHGGHDDHAAPSDMHIWLDPQNAQAMVSAIERALSEVDPGRAAAYAANAAAARQRLEALDRQLQAETAPLAGKRYVVFHDAYQYFERRYGLAPAGSITVSPDRPPSARRLKAIRAKIESGQAVCVFSEPQFEPALVRTVVDGTRARIGTLDVDGGIGVAAGPEAYVTIMQNLAGSLRSCLLPTG